MESSSKEDKDHWCVHCWNPVKRIQYKEGSIPLAAGEIQNVWKHLKQQATPSCSKNPLMDEDVTDVPFI